MWNGASLSAVNKAVVPIYLLQPILILVQIPGDAKWFTVLDLKDAFFRIPTHSSSQYVCPQVDEPLLGPNATVPGQYCLRGLKTAHTCSVVLVVKNTLANAGDARRPRFDPWVRKIPEEEMATHSSILAWRIPWTEEPGGLQSMGSHRVGLN